MIDLIEAGYDLTPNGVPGIVLANKAEHDLLEAGIKAVVPHDPEILATRPISAWLDDLHDFYDQNPKTKGMAKLVRGFKVKLPKLKKLL